MPLPAFLQEALVEYQGLIRRLPPQGAPVTREQEEMFQDAMNLRYWIEDALDKWLPKGRAR